MISIPMKQFMVTINPSGSQLKGSSGDNLKRLLERADYFFPNNCGGKGKCLSCRIEYPDSPPPIKKGESKYLAPDGNYRMACQHALNEDISISVSGFTVDSGTKSLGNFSIPGGGDGYGIAIDLGTTLIALYAVDLSTGKVDVASSLVNPQMKFGGDVMSRLESAKKNKLRKQMTTLVRKRTRELINHAITKLGIRRNEITRLYICGNSAMTHLWLGYGGEGLERAPFRSIFEGKGTINFNPILVKLTDRCTAEVAPIISGYIGGDATAAILSTDLDVKEGNRLLIDFGTNGEMVLASNGQLTATSTAAGPAFEGVGMRSGRSATNGAIEGFNADGAPQTIGSSLPTGFCGSGYISAFSLLLKQGLLTDSGLLTKNRDNLPEWSPMESGLPIINQDDVRQFQLAKGAIAAGIEILCAHAGIETVELDEIILTGSFGSRIDPQAAINIGLIPNLPLDRITLIGNGAGRGAALCLSDDVYRKRAEEIQKNVTVINLGEMSSFQDLFVENMKFG